MHERVDEGPSETRAGVRVARHLALRSLRLGLTGRADVVEFHAGAAGAERVVPVEYKRGKPKWDDSDVVQLCAQALCLEEMFGIAIERGAIFHAETKRRREVEFTPGLRTFTENAIVELRRLIEQERVPPAVFKPACQECSLFEMCLPKATCASDRLTRAANGLFQI